MRTLLVVVVGVLDGDGGLGGIRGFGEGSIEGWRGGFGGCGGDAVVGLGWGVVGVCCVLLYC